MMSADLFLTGLLAVIGLAATGGGFLYRRDSHQQDEIDKNGKAITELDRGFAQLTTRLFGHPDDESDRGAVPTRAEEIQRAEREIDSLSAEIHTVKEQSEENGDAIDELEDQVVEHAKEMSEALHRIESYLNGAEVIDGNGEFLMDGGEEGG